MRLGEGGRAEPNCRATMVPLQDGLVAASQNRWPSLAFDLMAVNGWLSPLFPAGFYYKTFKWPASFWTRVYERLIRRAAGLGEAPRAPDPDRYDKRHAHCDVLVVGGGPAGLAAALAAGRGGARVCSSTSRRASAAGCWPSGSRSRTRRRSTGSRRRWPSSRGLPEVTLLPRTTAFGYYDHNLVALLEELAADARLRPSAPAPVDGAGARGGARDRRDRAAAGVRRQRPAGRDAGGRGARLPQPLRRRAGQPARSSSPPATTPIAPRSIWRRRASRSPRWSTPASSPDRPLAAGGARRRDRDADRPRGDPRARRRRARGGRGHAPRARRR